MDSYTDPSDMNSWYYFSIPYLGFMYKYITQFVQGSLNDVHMSILDLCKYLFSEPPVRYWKSTAADKVTSAPVRTALSLIAEPLSSKRVPLSQYK
jgi:hypothetical protein